MVPLIPFMACVRNEARDVNNPVHALARVGAALSLLDRQLQDILHAALLRHFHIAAAKHDSP